MEQPQSSDATGTRDETYDVISILYHALQGAENCEIFAEDSERDELRRFFQEAGEQQRQLAERGKQLLIQCLQNETGQSGRGAFFGQASPGSMESTNDQSETVTSGPSGGSTGGGL
jgi:hypothetical protein